MKAGVAQSTLDALAAGQRPEGLNDSEAALYDFCRGVHDRREPSQTEHDRAVQAVGEQGVVDAVGLCGYYALLAMVLNSEGGGTAPP